jgi:tyrosine-protein kinase Etk/Wzc
LKGPEDIQQHLRLPFLGLLPVVRMPTGQPNRARFATHGAAAYSESVRRIRSNIMLASPGTAPTSLLVTSTAPREGKTMMAVNLALAFAHAGRRVVVVDADMRRPAVAGLTSGSADPGLSRYLAGRAELREVVRSTEVANLSVVPAGSRPSNPTELLGLPRLKDLLDQLGRDFDWIIVDSPPIMAVADATLIAPLVSGVLFVVGADMTRRDTAQAAIEQLAHAHARFAGAVLNKADVARHGRYYARYYSPEYEAYYIEPEARRGPLSLSIRS